jgi:hypothetical protein
MREVQVYFTEMEQKQKGRIEGSYREGFIYAGPD